MVDYELAQVARLDFVFVYGASQVKNWQSCIDQSKVVACIRDFVECDLSGGK